MQSLPLKLALVTTTALALTLALAGCATIKSVTDTPVQADYPTWADVANSTTPTALPPAFVPHDATNMYVRASTLSSAEIITYTSKTPPDATLCKPGTLTGAPTLDTTWWPNTKPPATGELCSPGWRLFTVAGETYGWRN
ncbi:MAG: hypothetical protein QOH77_926 [Actinomycetota bacterium]|jgi:hypothetical protein|nr:hypothetical protein [Actinomycetota bacterium]MDQ1574091.1 hypothetical protein [Actinomycetota bacterium]